MKTIRVILSIYILVLLQACLHTTINSRAISNKNISSSEQGLKEIKENNAVVIDVRTEKEFSEGHLAYALNIPYDEIEGNLELLRTYQNNSIVLYCKSGRRAEIAKNILIKNGFSKVLNAGGYQELKALSKE